MGCPVRHVQNRNHPALTPSSDVGCDIASIIHQTPQIGILGRPAIATTQGWVAIAGPEGRLLATLALRANDHVSSELLQRLIWPDVDAQSARNRLKSAAWRLRKSHLFAAAAATIESGNGGYRLRVAADNVDASMAHQLIADAGNLLASGHPDEACSMAEDAAALWRGQPFEGLDRPEEFLTELIDLKNVRTRAIEIRATALLQTGGGRECVPSLYELTRSQPHRQESWLLLIRGLRATHRPANALSAINDARDQLGPESHAALAELETAILAEAPDVPSSPVAAEIGAVRTGQAPPNRQRELNELRHIAAYAGPLDVLAVVGPAGVGISTLLEAYVGDIDEYHWIDGPRVVLSAQPATLPAASTVIVDNFQEAGPGLVHLLGRWRSSSPSLTIVVGATSPRHAAEERLTELRRQTRGGAIRLELAAFDVEVPHAPADLKTADSMAVAGGLPGAAAALERHRAGDDKASAQLHNLLSRLIAEIDTTGQSLLRSLLDDDGTISIPSALRQPLEGKRSLRVASMLDSALARGVLKHTGPGRLSVSTPLLIPMVGIDLNTSTTRTPT